MDLLSVAKVLQGMLPINSEISICGWVRTKRDSKSGISFISIYDGSCCNSVQAVVKSSIPNYRNEILRLTTGCSVIITGKIVLSPSKGQKFEILAKKIDVIGEIKNPNTYPISPKYHSNEYLRKVAHLRSRTNLIGAISRIRHTLAQAQHRFFNEKGYLWIPTPIITTLDTEGSGKMFRVSTLDMKKISFTSEGKINYVNDFFGKESFLTVSGQLHGEAYACALSKIYTFGPTFRAENSNTSRHLAEFWMLEPEVAFATLDDISNLAESMLKYVFNELLKERLDDMNFFSEKIDSNLIKRLEHLISTKFVQIEYNDAISILNKENKKFKNPIYWGINLSSEHEKHLSERYFKSPVIVKNYPKSVKAFYMRLNDDNKTVASMDVLVPGIGEIIGGSQREERLDVLDRRIKEMSLDRKKYWWYRDLRRYGTVPHSGFGLGFERLVSYVTGVKNIRDVVPFPRTTNSAEF